MPNQLKIEAVLNCNVPLDQSVGSNPTVLGEDLRHVITKVICAACTNNDGAASLYLRGMPEAKPRAAVCNTPCYENRSTKE